jgi:PLP dependent protein
MDKILENLIKIKSAINAAESKYQRPLGSVHLLAVSKGQTTDKIKTAITSGQNNFGENYLQEALTKIKELELSYPNIIWHYIGQIQSNKTKLIAQKFSWVESVPSIEIATLLNKYRPDSSLPLNICIQVNLAMNNNKAGVFPGEIIPLAEKIMQLPRLKLRGFMAIPSIFNEFDQQFKVFCEIELLFKKLKNHFPNIDTLSMGMSNDFAAAIAAGSTRIRIGTAIFGSRA